MTQQHKYVSYLFARSNVNKTIHLLRGRVKKVRCEVGQIKKKFL